jgi:hypothetical protein
MGMQLLNTKGRTVDEERIGQLKKGFRGRLIRPEDDHYDYARKIWNASVDKRPGLIARCVGVGDVVAAVRFARENDVLVAVRGGGHNVGGRALCDDGLVIDLSQNRGVYVDPKRRTARVHAGALLGDLDCETHVYSLAVPAGVVSKTGVAGLTLGGGVGWLVRKFGLTCDNVRSFELVTAEGESLTASADENQDLYWALRGGGGNFGVVTSFEYQAHPVSTVLGGMILHPRDKALELLKFYREFILGAPEELTVFAGLLCAPDGTPVVGAIACYCGDLAAGEAALKPLRAFGTPILDAIQPMPFPQMQSLLDDSFPDGNQNYWKSTFTQELSDDAIATIVEHANQAKSPFTSVVIEFYGGAMSRIGAADTAFAHRDAVWDIGIMAQWTDPKESEQHIAWARGMAEAVRPFSSGAYLLNFLGEESDATIRAAFGSNYSRLAAIKNKYDPTNFFRINQNIPPTAAG